MTRDTVVKVVGAGLSLLAAAVLAVVVPDIYARLTAEKSQAPASASPSSAPLSPAPLTAVVSSAGVCGGTYILPREALADLPAYERLDSNWVYEHGGFDAPQFFFSGYILTIQGRSEQAVVLSGLHVARVAEKEPAVDPVELDLCPGGGDLAPRHFEIDLGKSLPAVVPKRGDRDEPGDDADDPVAFPYKVSSTDPEVFYLQVFNDTGRYLEWSLDLAWTSGGQSDTIPVGLQDGRFLTAPGNMKIPKYVYYQDGHLEPR